MLSFFQLTVGQWIQKPRVSKKDQSLGKMGESCCGENSLTDTKLCVYDSVKTCSQDWKKTEEQVWESHYIFTAIGQQMLFEIEMCVP